MAATVFSVILGSYLSIICIVTLILNVAVLYVLYKGKFLTSTYNPIYLFAFANICGSVLTQALFGFYLGPSCMLQVGVLINENSII